MAVHDSHGRRQRVALIDSKACPYDEWASPRLRAEPAGAVADQGEVPVDDRSVPALRHRQLALDDPATHPPGAYRCSSIHGL